MRLNKVAGGDRDSMARSKEEAARYYYNDNTPTRKLYQKNFQGNIIIRVKEKC